VKIKDLISGDRENKSIDFENILYKYPEEIRRDISKAINEFFDAKDSDLRRYILTNLNAYFLCQASQLKEDHIQYIYRKLEDTVQFTIYIDTNFLFSILNLHDNPSNEAAINLFELTKELDAQMGFEFCILPITFNEARRSITSARDRLIDLRLTPKIRRILKSREEFNDFSGILIKFINDIEKSEKSIGADEYFAPYIDDFSRFLRANNIQLLDVDVDNLSTEQEIMDDIVDQVELETQRKRKRKKGYDKWKHDIVLWHYVNRLRAQTVSALLDAKYWIVTLDFSFLGFDSVKKKDVKDAKNTRDDIPVCLHPSVLVQMLQFWIPVDHKYEIALLESIRPMLPRSIDTEAEEIAMKIVAVLSRYEDMDDIPEKVIASLFANKAIKQRLKSEPDVESQITLVREALIAEAKELEYKLKMSENWQTRLRDKLAEKDETIKELIGELKRGRQHTIGIEERLDRIEKEKEEKEYQSRITKKKIYTLIVFFIFLGFSAIFIPFAQTFITQKIGLGNLISIIIPLSVISCAFVSLIEFISRKEKGISQWKLIVNIRKSYRWIPTFIGAVFIGVLANIVKDYIKWQDIIDFINMVYVKVKHL